ncbi:hypothetical protein BZG36_02683 [Bifiguratus adelaidae]|uniref:Oxidoreductase n=1 Tax=Bifiguratus adelaidae TaxID=1938954 RepID=A0A261Y1I6_9FUNG|nr:hypothetical protein BZG36_02683 [Bifiguratus adelaidae]
MSTEHFRKLGLPLTKEEEPEGYRTTAADVMNNLPASSFVQGKTFIVTGGHVGLGEGTTRALAAHGAKAVIGSRNQAKAEESIRSIQSAYPKADIRFIHIDLSDLESVQQFAQNFRKQGLPLHGIVCNAGIMAVPYGKTKQGFEMHFGTNHISHFLLIKLLIDDIVKSGEGRVVCLSSKAHDRSDVHFEDVGFNNGQDYDPMTGYAQSKTANILCAKAFNKIYSAKRVECFAVHPGKAGIVITPLSQHIGTTGMVAFSMLDPEGNPNPGLKTVAEGAATQVYALTSPELDGMGGTYLADCHVSEPLNDQARDNSGEYSKHLFDLTEKLIEPFMSQYC